MKRVLYGLPGMEAAPVRRDLEYRSGGQGAPTMNVCYPPGHALSRARRSAVIFIFGYSDSGFQKMLGCKQ